MKELSIEEKAKAYDEAIERVKEQAIDGYLDAVAVKDIFPELKESEDERIRKEIISHLKYLGKYCQESMPDVDKWLAWLEKQGETFTKKDVDDAYLKGVCDTKKELEKQGEQKPAWSEEDKKMLNLIIARLHSHHKVDSEEYSKEYHWLKSLKDRHIWKPNDAQMASITCAVRKMKESACYDSELVSLFNDLKKIKG